MKSYNSKEVIKILKANGWVLLIVRGSHNYFVNPKKMALGKITVPHPKKDLPIKTVESIFKQAGLKF